MATEEKAKTDPQLERQRATVSELGRAPEDTEHPGEVARAQATEHGEKSGLKPIVNDLHDRREKVKLGGGAEKIAQQHEKGKLTARERIEAIKNYLSFFPSNCEQGPPRAESSDPIDRLDEELLDIVPESPRHAYD